MPRKYNITGRSGRVRIHARSATKPASFNVLVYTGAALEIQHYDLPVVIDLAGLTIGKQLQANLDHDPKQRIATGFTMENDGRKLVAKGVINAANQHSKELIASAKQGYRWAASLEVQPRSIDTVKAGKTVSVNGRSFTGPLYVTRSGTFSGFAFLALGADSESAVSIAAKKSKSLMAEHVGTMPIARRMAACGAASLLVLELATGVDGFTIGSILASKGIAPAYELRGVSHWPAFESIHAILDYKKENN